MDETSEFDCAAAVAEFWDSAARGIHYPPAWHDRLSLQQAFQVQLGLLDRHAAEGAEQLGWKVGLTAQAIQQQFNVHEPVFGYLLAEGLIRSGAVLDPGNLMAPGFENEICMRLGKDLVGPGVTAASAWSAVESLYPALELIETRGDLSHQLAVAIADNVQQKGFVLGARFVPSPDLDLRVVTAQVYVNDDKVAEGIGSAVLGNPLNSLAWLANRLADFGRSLRAGQYVMAGSLTRQFPLRASDRIRTGFDPIGEVCLTMGSGVPTAV